MNPFARGNSALPGYGSHVFRGLVVTVVVAATQIIYITPAESTEPIKNDLPALPNVWYRNTLPQPGQLQELADSARRGRGQASIALNAASQSDPRSTFEPVLQPPVNPAEAIDGRRIAEVLDSFTVRLTPGADGRASIAASTTPLAVSQGTALTPIDLRLIADGSSAVPAQATTGVRIPRSVTDRFSVGGVSFTVAGLDPTEAKVDGRSVTWDGGADSASLVAQPTSTGLELWTPIPMPAATSDVTYRFDLPAGVVIAATLDGGATLTDNTNIKLEVLPPAAIDAKGHPVPVRFTVDGATLTQTITPDADTAWPVLVDPVLVDHRSEFAGNSTNAPDLASGGWSYAGAFNPRVNCYAPVSCYSTSGGGYYIYDNPTDVLPPSTAGNFTYGVPDPATTSYIQSVAFTRLYFVSRDGVQFPYGYAALARRDGTGWNQLQTYPNTRMATGPTLTGTYTPGNRNSDAVYAAFGLSSSGAAANTIRSQWREIMSDGVIVSLTDPENAFVNAAAPASRWTKASTLPVDILASDAGLGVKQVQVKEGSASAGTPVGPGCTGLYPNKCPTSFGPSYTLPLGTTSQGLRTFAATADDPVSGHTSPAVSFDAGLDVGAPLIGTLTGSLYDNRSTSFADTRAIRIPLTGEGSVATPSNRRSGVHRIRLIVDGDNVVSQRDFPQKDSFVPEAGGDDNILSVNAAELTPGTHTVQVDVGDWAENTRLATSFTITTTADVTAPGIASDLQAVRDAATGATTVSWAVASDNGLPDGTRASGVDTYLYRYRIGSGAYTAWATTTANAMFALSGVSAGQALSVDVQARDRAGSVGATYASTVTVASPTWNEDNVGNADPGESGDAPLDPEPDTLGDNDDGLPNVGGGAGSFSAFAASSFILCPVVDPCGTYNGAAAAAYALYWSQDGNGSGSRYNNVYYSYFGGHGGDCTNFVSQSLKAGGMHFMRTDDGFNSAAIDFNTDKVHHGVGSWWAGRGHVTDGLPSGFRVGHVSTASFNRAYTLYGHLLDYGLATRVNGAANVRVGDLVFFNLRNGDPVDRNNADHTQIVVRVTSRGFTVAQHSPGYVFTFKHVLDERVGGVRGTNYNYTILHPRYSSANII
jgi:hypothetical protein